MHTIIEDLKNIASMNKDLNQLVIRSKLKEYLQDYVLDFIYSSEYKNLIFYGGTCLRKVYGLDRMSEDLDFETLDDISLEGFSRDLKKYFIDMLKFDSIECKIQKNENISRITIKFAVLKDLGLSVFNSENLHVKVEINKTKISYPTIITPLSIARFTMLVRHYDLPVLMAGKINACLNRSFKKGSLGVYIKGRDFYDLVWYMQKGVLPEVKDISDTFRMLDEKVEKISSSDLYSDLYTFFERANYIKDWCDNFHDLYKRYRKVYE